MNALKFLKKVPAGMFIIPLLCAAILNTILVFAGADGGVRSLQPTLSTVAFVIVIFSAGLQINLRSAPKLLARSAVLLIVKFAAGVIIGFAVSGIFGMEGVLGVSALACIAGVTNSNGGMYLNLVADYGNADDAMTYALLAFNDGPYLTMIAMSVGGLASIPFKSIAISFAPMFVGLIIGNIFPKVAKPARIVMGVALIFYAVVLGLGINLTSVLLAGFGGILLGVVAVIGSGVPLVAADRFINRRPGYGGAAIASVAGNAVATPAIIASLDPTWAPYVENAVAAVSAAVVVSAILTPLFTHYVAKKFGCPKFDKEVKEAAA